jgi:hypothetical protein
MRHGIWIMAENLPALSLTLRKFLSRKCRENFTESFCARRLAWVVNRIAGEFNSFDMLLQLHPAASSLFRGFRLAVFVNLNRQP